MVLGKGGVQQLFGLPARIGGHQVGGHVVCGPERRAEGVRAGGGNGGQAGLCANGRHFGQGVAAYDDHALQESVVVALFLALLPAWFNAAPAVLLTCIAAVMLFLAILAIDSVVRLRAPQAFFIVPFLFILQQGAYGIGFLLSLIRPEKIDR